MVLIRFDQHQVTCKLVYYGPGLSGKTTNLDIIHAKAPKHSRGEMTKIATRGDRTLYFDYMPLDVGQVAGMKTTFQLYTVPGQIYYNNTRKLVLQGVDGIVFVADSNPAKMPENLESLDNLKENLASLDLAFDDIPVVLQLNKRDLPNAMPMSEMSAVLNPYGWPVLEAVAKDGQGVFVTLKEIGRLVLDKVNQQRELPQTLRRRGPSAVVKAAVVPPPVNQTPAAMPTPIVRPPQPSSAANAPTPVQRVSAAAATTPASVVRPITEQISQQPVVQAKTAPAVPLTRIVTAAEAQALPRRTATAVPPAEAVSPKSETAPDRPASGPRSTRRTQRAETAQSDPSVYAVVTTPVQKKSKITTVVQILLAFILVVFLCLLICFALMLFWPAFAKVTVPYLPPKIQKALFVDEEPTPPPAQPTPQVPHKP